jgi:hypothetical protein
LRSNREQSPPAPDVPPQLAPIEVRPAQRRPDHRIWTFEDGVQVIRLETPSDMTLAQWTLLDAYVKAIKPQPQTLSSTEG